MGAVGLIPARYAASRFPGKPLAPIAGRPMVEWVYRGACGAKGLAEVVVATDDERIAEACRGFGAPVVMTAADHPTGSDRIAEVARELAADVVVNIQGDEPLVEGFLVDAALEALAADPGAGLATLAHEAEPEARDDPNRVKVVCDLAGRALYFSRAGLPFPRSEAPAPWVHVGLYAYRREVLLRLVDLPQTPAERAESLEQLRALEHGIPIRVARIEGWESAAVDVPGDVARVEARLARRD